MWFRYCAGYIISPPYDSSPEEAEKYVESQRAPDDKVVNPGPVPGVQSQLQRKTLVSSSALWCIDKKQPAGGGVYLECNREDQDGEDNCSIRPVSKDLHSKERTNGKIPLLVFASRRATSSVPSI